ncbi:sigma-70 family RNA polymerase sigma factor [Acinetobacter rudis]|uniref:sigma-70 family RNA polymerase sigma factor n=1 Tax=Acinetobacter rudis TaxID=632955 RepID=UPI0028102E48|nr:sigma-70 family RNA polymerase sigma factor [Acinetobacter rudis]MDQ8952224.1 sigma-70 family RNA polymerase sigma factor [Acinetobacter rudis]
MVLMDSLSKSATQHQLIENMYNNHHIWLRSWLNQRVSYPLNASDLVQDTFVRLLQTKQSLQEIREPRAFLLHIAKHISIDKQRRYQLEKNYLFSLEQQLEAYESQLSQQDIFDAIEILDFLSITLVDTSIYVRQAFVMYYFEGYSQSEISLHLNKSLRSVQGYLAKSLSLCYASRKKLDDIAHA